jgi:hypothetical protein
MSTQDSTGPGFQLLSLAPEIVENAIKQVNDKRDLSNVRLVCKQLNKHATKKLFRDIFVSPSEENVGTWNSISQDDNIRQTPRSAIIHTHTCVDSEVERDMFGNIIENEEISDGLEQVLAALPRFSNLDSIEIHFTRECIGDHETMRWETVVEPMSRREEVLTLIFQAIKDRAVDKKNRTIRKLTIVNLQNCHTAELTNSNLFRDVMGQLRELHLSIMPEHNDRVPDRDYERIELRTFPAYLCSEWLQPISANLRALSLYHQEDNWGPFPGYFDFSGLEFPNLETLALGYYTLAHDNDLDWVLAIKSLRRLILHNCMVASKVRINKTNMDKWKVQTHDWTRARDADQDGWTDRFMYGGKWSQYLNRIGSELPNLIDIRFDYVPQDTEVPYSIQHRNDCRTRIFVQRYISFDNGVLPTHWLEERGDGTLEMWMDEKTVTNVHKDSFDEDQRSLGSLVEKLRARGSGHV